MPGCFCVPDAGAKCSSARAVIGASSTAEPVAAASLGVNRCVRRDAGISSLDAAGTVTPSASAATGVGAHHVAKQGGVISNLHGKGTVMPTHSGRIGSGAAKAKRK